MNDAPQLSPGVTLRGKVIAAVILITAIVLGALVVFTIDRRPRTHDARIFAYSAAMASEINGRITRFLISNDQHVEAGAPLILIDPTPYEMQLREARGGGESGEFRAQVKELSGRRMGRRARRAGGGRN